MEQILGYLYVGFMNYLIPFVLAIGIIYLLYGIFNYFILGPGEEEKREIGREQLLWAMLIFFLGLGLYVLVAAVLWLVMWATQAVDHVDLDQELKVQNVPNVPDRNY